MVYKPLYQVWITQSFIILSYWTYFNQGQTPIDPCLAFETCNACIGDPRRCYWCNSDSYCRSLPARSNTPFLGECLNEAYQVNQCIFSTNLTVIIIAVVGSVAAICFSWIVYCYCCRDRNRDKYDIQIRNYARIKRERRRRYYETKNQRRSYSDSIRQKYSLPSAGSTRARTSSQRSWISGRRGGPSFLSRIFSSNHQSQSDHNMATPASRRQLEISHLGLTTV
ncbi:hypothetical protein TrispH2_008371 [Trichoplax sp. H2]|nr:hypothetical protein TrispH2_008371 [Trichoplax sp. H2]|eukprot:RDD38506.1 hypothetical protein TrispH2_008371 [Trichoplax sp. H2]